MSMQVSNISSVNVSAASFHADNITDSVLDNPHINTYAFVYGMFLLAMLIILVGRSLVFVKVSTSFIFSAVFFISKVRTPIVSMGQGIYEDLVIQISFFIFMKQCC